MKKGEQVAKERLGEKVKKKIQAKIHSSLGKRLQYTFSPLKCLL